MKQMLGCFNAASTAWSGMFCKSQGSLTEFVLTVVGESETLHGSNTCSLFAHQQERGTKIWLKTYPKRFSVAQEERLNSSSGYLKFCQKGRADQAHSTTNLRPLPLLRVIELFANNVRFFYLKAVNKARCVLFLNFDLQMIDPDCIAI